VSGRCPCNLIAQLPQNLGGGGFDWPKDKSVTVSKAQYHPPIGISTCLYIV
jgi:hypothetical protein